MTNTAGIITYGAGNIFSLCSALERLGLSYKMIDSPEAMQGCSRYIIPGVGHAGQAMKKFNDKGFAPAITALEVPVLGICVGLQLLTAYSEEGDSQLTGVLPVSTRLFPQREGFKVPHMGWNQVKPLLNDRLFAGLPEAGHFYFVHSYFIEFNPNFTIGSTFYGEDFSASLRKDNFWGVQFHPEKSGKNGEILLKNFYTL